MASHPPSELDCFHLKNFGYDPAKEAAGHTQPRGAQQSAGSEAPQADSGGEARAADAGSKLKGQATEP